MWRVEVSDDGRAWTKDSEFHSAALALQAYDLEVRMAEHRFVRLVNARGVVEERADLLLEM